MALKKYYQIRLPDVFARSVVLLSMSNYDIFVKNAIILSETYNLRKFCQFFHNCGNKNSSCKHKLFQHGSVFFFSDFPHHHNCIIIIISSVIFMQQSNCNYSQKSYVLHPLPFSICIYIQKKKTCTTNTTKQNYCRFLPRIQFSVFGLLQIVLEYQKYQKQGLQERFWEE